jgi:hypothetical protein
MTKRRELLKALSVTGAVGVVDTWKKPVVSAVLLPVHAQSTLEDEVQNVPCSSGPQIRVFDDGAGSTTDDSFNVYIDGQFVLLIPAPANAELDGCLTGLTSGNHTIRIEFVEDIDDPDGNDPNSDGSYAIELFQGITFDGGGTTRSGDLFPQGASDSYGIIVP